MQLGMIGLGRMGGNMVRRILKAGHRCTVFDASPDRVQELSREGAEGAASLGDFVARLPPPRIVWTMLPAGAPTETTIAALGEMLQAGDTVVDGGNSYFKDDVRRAAMLEARGVRFVDVGTSGGVWGIERGYCLMIGGAADAVGTLQPIFSALAPGSGDVPGTPGREGRATTAESGYLHCGPPGAGHFVKMVHNGIEYGLMQAYAEGFDVLRHAGEPFHYELDLPEIAEVWRRGSVIGSWLLDLTAAALAQDPGLDRYSGFVQDSGEGRWTVMTAIEEAVPVTVLSAALYERFRSRQTQTFGDKLLSAMREQFGGHREPPSGP